MSGKSSPVENRAAGEFRRAVGASTRAVLAAQVGSQAISLVVLALLYRLVEQRAFGLLGMALPLVTLPRMTATLGLNVAAVQHQRMAPGEMSSLFWANAALGVASAAVTALLAPLFAWLYEAPELTPVCMALGVTSLLGALGAQHQALLERSLLLGRLQVVRLAAQAAGGAAGVMVALAGGGVWALVGQQYVEWTLLSAGLWIAQPWRPSRLGQGAPIGSLLRFGGYYSLSSIVLYIAQNLDKVLLAFFLGGTAAGQAALGVYAQAFNIMAKPVYIVTNPITAVMLPALSRARRDRSQFAELAFRFFGAATLALPPAAAGLFLLADDLMQLLAPQWDGAGAVLRALSPTVPALGLLFLGGVLLTSAGRAGRLLIAALVAALVLAQGYLAGYWISGLGDPAPFIRTLGVAWAYSCTLLVAVLAPYLWFCFTAAGLPIGALVRIALRPLAATLSMAVVVWLMRSLLLTANLPLTFRLMLLIACGVLVYAALMRGEIRRLYGALLRGDAV